jgi:hypothetical protein
MGDKRPEVYEEEIKKLSALNQEVEKKFEQLTLLFNEISTAFTYLLQRHGDRLCLSKEIIGEIQRDQNQRLTISENEDGTSRIYAAAQSRLVEAPRSRLSVVPGGSVAVPCRDR